MRADSVVGWVQRHALALCLPIQAALLLTALDRLPPWGDEYASLARARLPLAALLEALRWNVHPPLYPVLLHGWLALPWEAPAVLRARALSALLLLGATLALDRTWLRQVDGRTRAWFLALWTVSPAVLLYGRMARSYSLQLLLALLALWAGWRGVREPSLGRSLVYAGVATLLLYTHYLPGLAVLTAVGLAALWQLAMQRDRTALQALLVPLAVVGVAYAAWLPELSAAVGRVGRGGSPPVFGSRWLDAAAALAYAAVTFTAGESLWPWMPFALVPLAAGLAVLLWRGLQPPPAWLAVVVPAAAIGFAGAARWVSVAFVAARVLFVLPFTLLLVLRGGRAAPRLRAWTGAAWLAVSLGGVTAYFAGAGFLNPAYVIPADAIAAAIMADGGDAPRLVLDHHNINLSPVLLALPAATRVLLVTSPPTADAAVALAGEAATAPLWFAHSMRDTSPGGWNARIEAAWQARCPLRRQRFAPYSALHRRVMHLAGWADAPTHVVELLELRCPPAAGPDGVR